ncbi:uncharacterized protein LOC120012457 [Tripterygium wilfordii]|uniref:uncharacterized protein LOC120012457 n=1 Tax=Tripterygium wilfordii TaxID=458696 RepID=UPI0018F7FC02|nr:uncharacterized protein LOC120012457 [Tripterygium wilfordii]
MVVTSFPIKTILHKPELSGRLTKWAIELTEHDIVYQPRTAIKAQILADFIAEFSPGLMDNAHKELRQNNGDDEAIWQLFVDGSSNAKGSGLGIILISPQGDQFPQVVHCGFHATNNEALIEGLKQAKELKVQRVHVTSDSQLIVNQLNGEYQAKDERMNNYLKEENQQADALTNLGSAIQVQTTQNVPLIYLESSTINKNSIVEQSFVIIENDDDWRTPFVQYLRDDMLPQDKNEARSLQRKASRYTIANGILYKRSYQGVLLRCLSQDEAQYALAELHEGVCENHSGGRSLASKVMQTDYYWPTLPGDAATYVAKYYFTKSVEAEAYKQVWDKEIKLCFASPRHPQSNGQSEATNKTIVSTLNKRLENTKGAWADELPGVLWSYRTTVRTSTNETPFSLTYGTEAVLPVELASQQHDLNGSEMRRITSPSLKS